MPSSVLSAAQPHPRPCGPSRSRCSASRRTTARGRRFAARSNDRIAPDARSAGPPAAVLLLAQVDDDPDSDEDGNRIPDPGATDAAPWAALHQALRRWDTAEIQRWARPPRLATPDLSARADAGAGARQHSTPPTSTAETPATPAEAASRAAQEADDRSKKDAARRRRHRRRQWWRCAAVRPRACARQSPHPARRPIGREGRDTMSRFLWISLGTLAATSGAIAGASYVHRRKPGRGLAGDGGCRPAGRRANPDTPIPRPSRARSPRSRGTAPDRCRPPQT
jgi:hypothetical protein